MIATCESEEQQQHPRTCSIAGLQCTDKTMRIPWTEACMADRRNLCRPPKVGWGNGISASPIIIDEVRQYGQVQVQKEEEEEEEE